MNEAKNTAYSKELSTGKAIALLVIAIATIFVGKLVLNGDIAVTLLVDTVIVSAIAVIWGVKWSDIEEQMKENLKSMTVPLVILMCVGLLVGTWIISGTIPTMVYYGMKFIHPNIFLVMACLIAALMSIMTGTSWGTVSTVGVALMGVSAGLQIPLPYTAGAITVGVALMGVSAGLQIPLPYTAGAITVGAIFGDKLSPLSETTVLSSAVADVDIVEHIKYMLFTTVPCLVISLILYAVLGIQHGSGSIQGADYDMMMETLQTTFNLNPLVLIPPVVVVVLIVLKKPTIPTFFVGISVAAVLAAVIQGATPSQVLTAMASGYTESTGVAVVDSMVIRGGLKSMFSTLILVMAAGVIGAPLRASGAVELIISKIEKVVKNEKQMMLAVGVMHIVLFLIVVSYYVSFILIGSMTDLYDKYGVDRKNLSRTLEDTGTAFAPLIPWGLSGAFYSTTLGVSTTQFAIFAPITYLSCVVGAIYIITGFTIARNKPQKDSASS